MPTAASWRVTPTLLATSVVAPGLQSPAWRKLNGAALAAKLLRELTAEVGTVLSPVIYGAR